MIDADDLHDEVLDAIEAYRDEIYDRGYEDVTGDRWDINDPDALFRDILPTLIAGSIKRVYDKYGLTVTPEVIARYDGELELAHHNIIDSELDAIALDADYLHEHLAAEYSVYDIDGISALHYNAVFDNATPPSWLEDAQHSDDKYFLVCDGEIIDSGRCLQELVYYILRNNIATLEQLKIKEIEGFCYKNI